MALKNTYAKKGADYYLNLTQNALIKGGANGIQMQFTDGKVTGLHFMIDLKGQNMTFRLPINWQNFQNVLQAEGNKRAGENDYCYKVAWACTKDWIEAQMAFIESENATLAQVFLPYAVTTEGNTLFESIASKPDILLLN